MLTASIGLPCYILMFVRLRWFFPFLTLTTSTVTQLCFLCFKQGTNLSYQSHKLFGVLLHGGKLTQPKPSLLGSIIHSRSYREQVQRRVYVGAHLLVSTVSSVEPRYDLSGCVMNNLTTIGMTSVQRR